MMHFLSLLLQEHHDTAFIMLPAGWADRLENSNRGVLFAVNDDG
jgi:hypothetical protein